MRSLLCLLLAALFSGSVSAQTLPLPVPASTPFLDLLRSKLLGSASKSSVTIKGTAQWTAGTTHGVGPATMVARVDGSHQVDLDLSKGKRSDKSGPFTARTCQWTDEKGGSHDASAGNCITPLPWFSPVLLPALLSQPGVLVTDLGEKTESGLLRHVLTMEPSGTVSGPDGAKLLKAYGVTVHYDPVALQPTSVDYSIHPDNGRGQLIPARIVFSDYRLISGVDVPFKIDRYINQALNLSITADSVSVQ